LEFCVVRILSHKRDQQILGLGVLAVGSKLLRCSEIHDPRRAQLPAPNGRRVSAAGEAPGLRERLSIVERAKHNIGINKPLVPMAEHTRKDTDNFESKLLPKSDGWLVSRHHKVELHCAKT